MKKAPLAHRREREKGGDKKNHWKKYKSTGKTA